MLRTISTFTLGLLILTGCPGDDTGTTVGDTAADSTTTAGTTESAETNPPGTTEVASESADSTTVNADTTDGPVSTSDPGTTTDETTTGMGGVCDPEAMDDDCAMCVKESCCMELEACQEDAGCVCFQDCAQKNPGIGGAMTCATKCDVDPFGGVVGPLTNCTLANCNVCLG